MAKEKTKKVSKIEERAGAMEKVMKFIKEDHKFENWLLFVLALLLSVLALYILIASVYNLNGAKNGTTEQQFAYNYFNIQGSGWKIFNKPWKVITTSSVVLAFALGALVYSLYPVFKPSFKELKYVTWTTKSELFKNSVTVIIFIVFLTVLFFLFGLILSPLFNLIFGA